MCALLYLQCVDLYDGALPLPGDGGRRLPAKPDIVPERVALLQLDVVHAGLVDEGLHCKYCFLFSDLLHLLSFTFCNNSFLKPLDKP